MFTYARMFALAAAAALLGAAPVTFEAPAKHAPAGAASAGDRFGRILPSGRLIHPTGLSTIVGMNAQGMTLTPSGRFAIVSNDDALEPNVASAVDPGISGGFSLAVVDTATMAVVSRYSDPGLALFEGLVAVPDPANSANTLVFAAGGSANAVFVFDLDSAGTLKPDAVPSVSIPGGGDAQFAFAARSFPGSLVLGPGGTTLYVLDNLSDDVAQIDVATRALSAARVATGYFPSGASATRAGLLVANGGLMAYRVANAPVPAPPFGAAPADLERSSSLDFFASAADGTLAAAPPETLPLDRPPDGTLVAGGANPAAVLAMRTRPYAFVAMANVDRVATVSLAGTQPAVVGGTELRLFDRGPYGTQPVALAIDRSERRLYVALAGIDAVAVLDSSDPRRLHRIGLIPTGWYPNALALSRDGRYLFVANAKGIGHDLATTAEAAGEDAAAQWSTLERIDLGRVNVRRTTPLALSYLRAIVPAARSPLVPHSFGSAGSTTLKHVVCIVMPGMTYDAALGDLTSDTGLPYGKGDPRYVAYGAAATPNLHALARTFGLAANFYADADRPDVAASLALAGMTSGFTQKTHRARYDSALPAAQTSHAEDPEDAIRLGSIFTALARRGESYRDYGALLRVTGYDANTGLYAYDVPAPAVLAGHVDAAYAGFNVHVSDRARAAEFERDFDPLAKAGTTPAFTFLWLPPTMLASDPATLDAADADQALGSVVDYLSHLPEWSSTAIFIEGGDALAAHDHVDAARTYAIVVSPYAKRHVFSLSHLSTASVLKTEEEILGLPALSLGDALSSDASDLFTGRADTTPYDRAPSQ